MNAFENLYSRRSIRSFTGEPVTEAQLQEILKAAYAAPVGRARYDTLQLTVITNKDYLRKMEAHMGEVVGEPGLHPFYGAPTLILVSSAGPLENVNYANAAIVVQNMALAATALGVGACHIWGAVRVMDSNAELMQGLNLPAGMEPCCALAIGQTEETYALRQVPRDRIATVYMD